MDTTLPTLPSEWSLRRRAGGPARGVKALGWGGGVLSLSSPPAVRPSQNWEALWGVQEGARSSVSYCRSV